MGEDHAPALGSGGSHLVGVGVSAEGGLGRLLFCSSGEQPSHKPREGGEHMRVLSEKGTSPPQPCQEVPGPAPPPGSPALAEDGAASLLMIGSAAPLCLGHPNPGSFLALPSAEGHAKPQVCHLYVERSGWLEDSVR